jgi:spore germination protein PE
MKRVSIVDNIHVLAMSSACIFHIGDNQVIRPRNHVFALQRKVAEFLGNEGNFDEPLFTDPIPQPAVICDVTMSVDNLGSFIKVGRVKILGVSSSSIVQAGNTELIDSEARIKNIRQFVTEPGESIGTPLAAELVLREGTESATK